MAALSVQVPYPVFYDRDGDPLDNGNIYIGVANLDPVTNPIQVYYDEALTIPAAQPLITSAGYIYRNGTPAQIYVDAVNFSITVNDSKNLLVYNFPDGTGISPNAAGVVFTGFKGQVGFVSDLADDDGSDWIGFDPDGASAVARSAQDKMRDVISVKDFGAVCDGVANDSPAFTAAIATQDPITVPNNFALANSVAKTGGYFSITGGGDAYTGTVTANPGISYVGPTGTTFDDHSRKELKRLHLKGDANPSTFAGGTMTLASLDGSYSSAHEMSFELGNIGLVQAKYVNDGFKNHYRANSLYGLHLNGVTAFTEREIYARGHNATTGAAVYISGADTENVRLSGGAIEGNRAAAIRVNSTGFTANAFKLLIDNVYFELDGDRAAGVPSISIPSDMGNGVAVAFRHCKLSYNVAGWTSGDYELGKSVILAGCSISGRTFAENATLTDGAYLSTPVLNPSREPMMVHRFSQVAWGGGDNAIGGHTFCAPLTGKPAMKFPITNLAPATTPYVTASTTTPPVISVNAVDDYGDGAWSQAAFNASAGSFGTNSVRIGNFIAATGLPFRVHIFLIKSATNTTLSFVESGAGTALSNIHTLVAGKTYKMVMLTNRALTGNQALVGYPTGTDGPVVNFLCLYQAAFADQWAATGFVEKMV